MNIYISYRKQYGFAKSVDEAIKIIEDFVNPDMDEYLVCNENIIAWIKNIIHDYPDTIAQWTTNAGPYKVYLIPTHQTSMELATQEVQERYKIKRENDMTENYLNRQEFYKWLNTPRPGKYHVSMNYSFIPEGETEPIGDSFNDIIPARSGHNAYLKAIDMIAELCDLRGVEFNKPRSIFAKTTKIEYIG